MCALWKDKYRRGQLHLIFQSLFRILILVSSLILLSSFLSLLNKEQSKCCICYFKIILMMQNHIFAIDFRPSHIFGLGKYLVHL